MLSDPTRIYRRYTQDNEDQTTSSRIRQTLREDIQLQGVINIVRAQFVLIHNLCLQ